jgi:hypothetical protein
MSRTECKYWRVVRHEDRGHRGVRVFPVSVGLNKAAAVRCANSLNDNVKSNPVVSFLAEEEVYA